MLTIDIPGSAPLTLTHLVLDYNGTIALDGELLPGVVQRLEQLRRSLTIHVLTADTHGTVREKLRATDIAVHVIGLQDQVAAKRRFVEELGTQFVVAAGNGRNDVQMLKAASLGICIIQQEGAASGALQAADVVTTSILDALDLLLLPDRLRATLRN
ncbi:HAD family hydrolase [Desulfosediminicola sp.]|uniref:HAD family hydrolase n=1 Tax=Desulfosediminicola sp. TaxID=2886825 RepID=UPI003AF29033